MLKKLFCITQVIQLEKWTPQYPASLLYLKRPPEVIYAYWDVELLQETLVSVVWPRKKTSYIERVTLDFMNQLQKYHCKTISWWAEWVDMICHTTSLEMNIPTIVVLWCWIEYAFKSRRRAFLQKVVDAWWLVLSQFHPWRSSAYWTFPQRNKVIAALAAFIFVPWWAKSSWTMLTTESAYQLWTPVYTVPWSIYEETQEWTNHALITKKVTPVESVKQVFVLENTPENTHIQEPLLEALSKDEKELLQLIGKKSTFEEIYAVSGRKIEKILSTITYLELWWYIYQPLQGEYIKK